MICETKIAQYFRLQEFVSYRIHHPLNYIDFIWNLNPKKWEMDRTLEDIDKYTNKVW